MSKLKMFFFPCVMALGCQVGGAQKEIALELPVVQCQHAASDKQSDAIDLVNTAGSTWRGVEVRVVGVDKSGRERATDETLVDEWKPGERVCVTADRQGSEKTIVILRQGRKTRVFEFDKLPLVEDPAQGAGGALSAEEAFLKQAAKEGRRNVSALIQDVRDTSLNQEQASLLWKTQWKDAEVAVPQCLLDNVARDHVSCTITDSGFALTARLSRPLSESLFLHYRKGMNCRVSGRLLDVPEGFSGGIKYSCISDSPPCYTIQLDRALLECEANGAVVTY